MSQLPARTEETRVDESSSAHELGQFPMRGRALIEATIAFLALVGLGLGLAWLLFGPLESTPIADVDTDVTVWFAENRTSTWDTLSDVASGFSDTVTVVVALVLLVSLFAWAWRRWHESLVLALALGLEASVFLAVSYIVGRDRPPVEQMDPSPPTASFPSGHVGAATAFYIGLAVIVFWNTERVWARTLAIAGAVLIPLAVAGSRLYRGMHYPSDVIVGFVLGVTCLVIAIFIARRSISRVASGAGRE